MAKLFLIRRNMESFAGPMTLVEMKEAYKRMAFGLQDEVSGHCGPWVAFDDLPKIKKYYPEVARVVHEDMLAGWGMSDHGRQIGGGNSAETRRLSASSSRRHLGLALLFLLVALVAFATAVYMAAPTRMSGKTKEDVDPAAPSAPAAQALLDAGDVDAFRSYMQQVQPAVVIQTTRSKKAAVDWLPLLRVQAFAAPGAAGEIAGLSPKVLRGNTAGAAPVDCSEKLWRRRFRSSTRQWSMMLGSRKIVRSHWARLLAWDPHWINRRVHRGWTQPRNYYVGCLAMVDKALAAIALEAGGPVPASGVIAAPGQPALAGSDIDRASLERMRRRVQWLLEVARDGRSSLSPLAAVRADDPLSQWSCYEAARDVRELKSCRDAMPAATGEWQSYTEERFNWNVLRLMVEQRDSMPSDLAAFAGPLAGKLSKTDFLTRFDYRAEQKLAKLLAVQPVDRATERAIERLGSEFPELKLAH